MMVHDWKAEGGQAMVEYALVLSCLFVTVFLVFFLNHGFKCSVQRLYLNAAYRLYLVSQDQFDQDTAFRQFMTQHHVEEGHYGYEDGRIVCSQCSSTPDPGPVPWL